MRCNRLQPHGRKGGSARAYTSRVTRAHWVAVSVAACWLLGFLLGAWLPQWWPALWTRLSAVGALTCASVGLSVHRQSRWKRWLAIPCAVLVLTAGARWGASHVATHAHTYLGHAATNPRLETRHGDAVVGSPTHEVYVESVQAQNGLTRSFLRVVDKGSAWFGERWVTRSALRAGSTLRVRGKLQPRAPFRNPSPHPPWPSTRITQGNLRIESMETLRRNRPLEVIGEARAHVQRALTRTLSTRVRGVVDALITGETRAMTDEDTAHVRAAGLAHVIAVSGYHVTLILGMMVLCIRAVLVRIRPLSERMWVTRIALAVACVIAPAYGVFSGGEPSAWRSVWTACLCWALVIAGRSSHLGLVTLAASVGYSIMQPWEAARPAFWLSLVATLAVASSFTTPDVSALRTLWVTTWRATIATAPIVLWCFEQLPWVSVLANLALVPFGSVALLPIALAHSVVSTALPAFDFLTTGVTEYAVTAFLEACGAFGSAPSGPALPPLTLMQGGCVAGMCALWLMPVRMRSRLWGTLCLIALLLFGEWAVRVTQRPRGAMRVTFVDVGQGDCTLIDLPDGRLMLVDGGGAVHGGPDPATRALVPLLRARRRSRIDVMVLSHPHPDHYAGLIEVSKHFGIGEVWDSGESESAEHGAGVNTVRTWLRSVRARGIPIRTADELCRAPRHLGDVTVETLWPCPSPIVGVSTNDNSLVLRLRYKQRSLLLTGDIEEFAESELLSRLDRPVAYLQADLMKVAHHGSRTSSSVDWLKAVQPRHAVISAGAGNMFGHPHPSTLARIAANGIKVHRLDQQGGLVWQTDGHRWTLH
jgi:competence protein ComEC